MTFNDIFKKSFIEGFSGQVGLKNILTSMGITCLLSLYIFFIYRLLTRKSFYSKSFNISLAGTALVTAAVILTVQSNVIVSLGMVGALSIVRFRTAIKDPMDLVFLFWAISVGIICGAGLAQIAVILSIILTAGIYILDRLPLARAPMMLVVSGDGIEVEDRLLESVRPLSRMCNVKTRTLTPGKYDAVLEVRPDDDAALIKAVAAVEGVRSVSLLSHDGEVTF